MGTEARMQFEDRNIRDERLLQLEGQIDFLLTKILSKMPTAAKKYREDLKSAAQERLLKHLDEFDPSKGKLNTWAEKQIRGAILDEVKKGFGVGNPIVDTQKANKFRKDRDEAARSVGQRLMRTPTQEEIAEQMGLPLGTYQKELTQATASFVRIQREDSSGKEISDLDLKVHQKPDIEFSQGPGENNDSGIKMLLRQIREKIPSQFRQILELYYEQGLNTEEIAPVIGVSPDRVSKLRREAVQWLKNYFEHKGYKVSAKNSRSANFKKSRLK